MNTDKGKAVSLSNMAHYYFLFIFIVHLGHNRKNPTLFM